MKKLIVLILTATMLAFVGSAQAFVEYAANFDTDSEGWNDGVETAVWYSTDGQDGGGFHTNMRNYWGPYLTPPSNSILFGNVAGNFDNQQITFSYYLKSISESMSSAPIVYMFADTDTVSGWDTWWKWDPPADAEVPIEWTQFAWTIDPTTTEPTEGWENGNNGPGTWAEGWQNIVSWNFWSGSGSGDNINGIDTVFVTNDPAAIIVPLVDIPGDADLDRDVDADDAATLAVNWLQSGKVWADGDFNEDGIVDDKDATLMAANWSNGASTGSSVPEPGVISLLLAALASLAAIRFTRRK